jgi:hypothetical protein
VGEQYVVIDGRYCGPPDSGNGGYVCGLVAGILGGPAEVTLRRPPPIGRPLRVLGGPESAVALLDRDEVVAEGVSARPEVHLPGPVTQEEAIEAAGRYRGFSLHPFPTCFVCGPQRAEGDGLRIFTGPVTGLGLVAAPWTPDETLTSADGLVRPEFVWAALDCPGAFANGFPEIAMVLGRLSAEVVGPVKPGQSCVVLGWSEGSEGRKHFAGTAIFGDDGQLLALARATWISLAPTDYLHK